MILLVRLGGSGKGKISALGSDMNKLGNIASKDINEMNNST
jgi:hypothetical protein